MIFQYLLLPYDRRKVEVSFEFAFVVEIAGFEGFEGVFWILGVAFETRLKENLFYKVADYQAWLALYV